MRKLLIIVPLILFLFFLTYLFYYSHFSENDKIGEQNFENFKSVKIGMDSVSVIKILGRPMDRHISIKQIYFDYEIPYGSYLQLQIIFDSTGKVIFKSL